MALPGTRTTRTKTGATILTSLPSPRPGFSERFGTVRQAKPYEALRAPRTDPNADLAAAVSAWLAAQGAGSGGGGGGGLSAAEQMAMDREQARLQAEESARGRTWEAEQARIQAEQGAQQAAEARAFEEKQAQIQREFQAAQEAAEREQRRQEQIANLQTQRQATYVDLLGRDPARAYLFGLGYGPEHDVFTTEAGRLGATLEPLFGAVQSAKGGEQALSSMTGRQITFGKYGVQGLGTPEQVARAYMQGSPEVQKMLTSAYGVGGTAPGAQPGISPESLAQAATLVTPTGGLNIA